MSRFSILAIAGFIGIAGVSSAAFAQSAPTTTEDVIVALGGGPSPESPQAARHEAVAALAQARRDCRREQGRDSQQQCLRAARQDYNDLMALAQREDRSQ